MIFVSTVSTAGYQTQIYLGTDRTDFLAIGIETVGTECLVLVLFAQSLCQHILILILPMLDYILFGKSFHATALC